MFRFSTFLIAISLGSISSTKADEIAARQALTCGHRPMACGSNWCCWDGQKCKATLNQQLPFVCVDPSVTNSDGGPVTAPAVNPMAELAAWNALTAALSLSGLSATEISGSIVITHVTNATTTGSVTATSTSTSIPPVKTSSSTKRKTDVDVGTWAAFLGIGVFLLLAVV